MAAKEKICKANVGTRKEPRACGKPIANGMRAACEDHRTTLIPTGESGIFYRGGSYVVVTRHRGRQYKTFHHSIGDAREAKGDRTGSAKQRPETRRLFDEYAREWVKNCQGRTRRGFDSDTRRAYTMALERYAIPHFRNTPLRDVDRGAINALIRKLQDRGLSANTIAKYLAPVRAMLGDAVENGHLQANPALGLKINAKVADHRGRESDHVKNMTRAELAAVLGRIPEPHRPVFELMANTGCRISEALGLEWGDLEQHGDVTTLRIERQWYRGKVKAPKTDAGKRTVELPPGLARRLWDLGADATGPMFHTRTGARLSDRNLTRILEAAAKRAGVPGITHHSFRHTHGSLLLDQGWTIPEVSERLGHANPAITAAVYSHRMRDRRRELSFLDELGSPALSSELKGSATASPERRRELGNAWATQHPETAVNAVSHIGTESGD